MATVSRGLPERPHLDIPKREARELLDDWRRSQPEALERIRARHTKFRKASDTDVSLKLADAQLVIAREYGLSNWPELKYRIEANQVAVDLMRAIRRDDRETAVRILRANPKLLHVPLWCGNWGPPMSHAANLGRLEVVRAIAALGARDHRHAIDRALLQGRIECARWLHAQGAKLVPGIVMGCCETLNAAGFGFLLELGAPLTDERGNRLAPLALTLETYCRNPAGKHAILTMFAQHGPELPDTPVMALHRGDVPRLREHLRRDPRLLGRRFALREIYPPECGCANDGGNGMHWTPIDGGTLLHLAVDFREIEIFDWLLSESANVNALAAVDANGFGGHTPLFNTVVNGLQRDDEMARALLERGAKKDARASLRKFLDWREQPRWHKVRGVTPVEWARTFPDQNWVNTGVLRLLERLEGMQ